jgi:hypothetical protein
MLKLKGNELEQYRASGLGKLIKIVAFQFKHHCFEVKEIHTKFGCVPRVEIIEQEYPEFIDRSITASVFTGMVLEAYFYDYACVSRSKTYANKVSNKNLKDEFLELTSIFENNNKVTDLSIRLENLRITRNHFVHNKSTDFGKYNASKNNWLTPNTCIDLLIDIFDCFASHYPDYILSDFLKRKLIILKNNEMGFY